MDFRKKVMKNGVVLTTEAMADLRSVSIGVWVKGGSRFEPESTPGISHFIEHLLFTGTTTRSAARIAEAIDSIGGELNAFTDKEYIGFYAKVLHRHLPFAFDLLSDIVLNPTFPTAEMNRERNVISEEISMVEDSPEELIHDIHMESMWKGHPLGLPISGTKESVARMTRKEVLHFFRTRYTGCNTVVSVAGKIHHEEVHKLAERYFSDLAAGDQVGPGLPPAARFLREVRVKPNLEQTHICFGGVCPPIVSKDRYCAQVLSHILGGGMSSRLFQNVRERRGLGYSIYSSLNLYRDAGTLVVYAGAAPTRISSVVDLTLKEFGRLRKRGVSVEEVQRAKESIIGSIMLSLESSSSRMANLAQQQIYYGRVYGLGETIKGIERITPREVKSLANKVLAPSRMAITVLGSNDGADLQRV